MTIPMKITLTTVSALTLAAAVLAALPAHAHDQAHGPSGEHMPRWLAAADTDGDGSLSKAERFAFKKERFAQFDADKNGQLSATELEAMIEDMKKHRYEHMLAKLDVDGDGAVTADEFAATDMRKFGHGGEHKRGGWFSWLWN